jgi:alpha-beta hydrolase superfamily lysophospholipase
MEAFGTRIRQALEEDWDEVLVVGHSSGAILACRSLPI